MGPGDRYQVLRVASTVTLPDGTELRMNYDQPIHEQDFVMGDMARKFNPDDVRALVDEDHVLLSVVGLDISEMIKQRMNRKDAYELVFRRLADGYIKAIEKEEGWPGVE